MTKIPVMNDNLHIFYLFLNCINDNLQFFFFFWFFFWGGGGGGGGGNLPLFLFFLLFFYPLCLDPVQFASLFVSYC